ncbi:hypothetical protein [Parasphingorhabdus sp.]|uniref:hypothetical protein n=1 Tax=Parasphingorhabdus sp. TaxID=2709688 RepID=UPI0030023975
MTEDFAEQTSPNGKADGRREVPALDRPLLDLPYNYSRDHGILFVAGDSKRIKIALRHGSDPLSLFEIQRYLAMPIDLEIVDEAGFEKLFNEHFAAAAKTGQNCRDCQ